MTLAVPDAGMTFVCHGRTHAGLVRLENEDSFELSPGGRILAVADGMGGHEFGRYVADCTVAAICAVPPADDVAGSLDRAREALVRTNREMWNRSQAMRQTMGATFVAAVPVRDRVGIAWAGNCRAYLLRDKILYCLTRDHSAVQQLLDSNSIGMLEAFDHPMRHVVTRALGAARDIVIDTGNHAVQPGDILLLTTDGLHGAINDDSIQNCLNRHGTEAVDHLIGRALSAGGRDNVTVVVARF